MRVYSQQFMAGCSLRHCVRSQNRVGNQGGDEDWAGGLYAEETTYEGNLRGRGRHRHNGRESRQARPHHFRGCLRSPERVKIYLFLIRAF